MQIRSKVMLLILLRASTPSHAQSSPSSHRLNALWLAFLEDLGRNASMIHLKPLYHESCPITTSKTSTAFQPSLDTPLNPQEIPWKEAKVPDGRLPYFEQVKLISGLAANRQAHLHDCLSKSCSSKVSIMQSWVENNQSVEEMTWTNHPSS